MFICLFKRDFHYTATWMIVDKHVRLLERRAAQLFFKRETVPRETLLKYAF